MRCVARARAAARALTLARRFASGQDGPPGAVLRARAHAARAANPLAHAAARRALPATVRARTRRALVLRCAPHWRLDFTRVRVSGHPGDASAAAAPRDVYELELEMMMAPAQPASPTALVVAECMAALAALAAAGRTVAADAARRRREYEMQRMAEEYVGARSGINAPECPCARKRARMTGHHADASVVAAWLTVGAGAMALMALCALAARGHYLRRGRHGASAGHGIVEERAWAPPAYDGSTTTTTTPPDYDFGLSSKDF